MSKSPMLKARPRIKSITVEIENPIKGTTLKTFEPADTEALFFSDNAVKNLLGVYYKNNPQKISVADSLNTFGQNITDKIKQKSSQRITGTSSTKILVQSQEIIITDAEIEELWETPADDGDLLPLVRKRPMSLPGYD